MILRHMRDSLGTGTVAPNQRVQIRQFKKIFSNLTSTEILTFKDKNGEDIKRPFTFINNPEEFKASIASMRQKDVNHLTTKYGLDNGQVNKAGEELFALFVIFFHFSLKKLIFNLDLFDLKHNESMNNLSNALPPFSSVNKNINDCRVLPNSPRQSIFWRRWDQASSRGRGSPREPRGSSRTQE